MLEEALAYLSSYDADPNLLELIHSVIEELGQRNIAPFQSTVITCHRCSSISAPKYEARRLGNKYILLCRTEDGGCAGKEILPQCQFVDNEGRGCDQPASHFISPSLGNDPEASDNRHACIRHIGALIKDEPNVLLGQHN